MTTHSRIFKIMKVFDCQDMPDDVRKRFFCYAGDWNTSNDSFVEWNTSDHYCAILSDEVTHGIVTHKGRLSSGTMVSIVKGYNIVNDWLLDNGADFQETILIKHWW